MTSDEQSSHVLQKRGSTEVNSVRSFVGSWPASETRGTLRENSSRSKPVLSSGLSSSAINYAHSRFFNVTPFPK